MPSLRILLIVSGLCWGGGKAMGCVEFFTTLSSSRSVLNAFALLALFLIYSG